MKLHALLPILLILTLSACTSVQVPLTATSDDAATDTAAPTQAPAEENAGAPQPPETLFATFSEPSTTNGDVLILAGQVLDVNGAPVPDATVEIWQTDATGVYDHPRDPGTDRHRRRRLVCLPHHFAGRV
jgi:protocatechuate 3,4-dioxygenase beta subunit